MTTAFDSSSRSFVFSDAELENLFDRHGVVEGGRSLVHRVRSSPPARSVRSGRGHITGAFPSRRMGCALQYESAPELQFLMECEYTPGRLEYFDQPDQLTLRYRGKNGRLVTVRHTPDFFLVSDKYLGFVECKPEEKLITLERENPNRWSRDQDGTWRSIPGEEAAARFGLGYRVRSCRSFSRILLDNEAFLRDYRDRALPPVAEDDASRVRDLIDRRCGLTLEELIHETGLPEVVYRLIVSGELYVDLASRFLSQPHLVLVFLDRQSARVWDAALACEVGRGQHPEPDGSLTQCAAEILQSASESDRECALQRYEALRPILDGVCPLRDFTDVPRRTIQSWLAAWRKAERDHECGFLGLIPRVRLRGNRCPRLEPELYELMDEAAEDVYERPQRPSMQIAYVHLNALCVSKELPVPSYKTFVQHLRKRSSQRQIARREGHRVAVATAPCIPGATDGFAQHGQRPFDVVHIDHTQVDLFLRLGGFVTERSERVWLTIAHCAWSRMPLGYALSFDPPSYGSCMMVLRDMVCRHKRLPRVVVVDNAGEFHSVAFDSLCAAFGVEKRHRPPGEPRYGSVCERFFGTVNTQLVHMLRGNTGVTPIRWTG